MRDRDCGTIRRRPLVMAMTIAAAMTTLTALACANRPPGGVPPTGTVELRTDEARRGEVEFMRYCHRCHPDGSSGLGPSLASSTLVPAVIRTQVRSGLGAMPAFPEEVISDDELDAIIAYLKERKRD